VLFQNFIYSIIRSVTLPVNLSQIELNWVGAHNLQASSLATGTYTNVPGVTVGPWANTYDEPQKFFRLADPYDN